MPNNYVPILLGLASSAIIFYLTMYNDDSALGKVLYGIAFLSMLYMFIKGFMQNAFAKRISTIPSMDIKNCWFAPVTTYLLMVTQLSLFLFTFFYSRIFYHDGNSLFIILFGLLLFYSCFRFYFTPGMVHRAMYQNLNILHQVMSEMKNEEKDSKQ
jgi:O-antigen/teichoic acid export membrane protein